MKTLMVVVVAMCGGCLGDDFIPTPGPDAADHVRPVDAEIAIDSEPDAPRDCTAFVDSLMPRPDLGSCYVRLPADTMLVSDGECTQINELYAECDTLYQHPINANRSGVVVVRDGFDGCVFNDCVDVDL